VSPYTASSRNSTKKHVFSYSKPTPIHVAFAAPDRITVRDFYTAALKAGGIPAGSPSYRGENREIFNAAVLDLDGNTIEVVHHRGHSETASTISQRSSRSASILKLQPQTEKEEYREADLDDEATDSAVDLPRVTSSLRRPSLPSQLCSQSGKTPANSLLGTMIGAAAGAAAIYAFYSTERDSAREEEAFNTRTSRRHSSTGARPEMSQYRSVYTRGPKDYRRHSEPAVDTSYTQPSQQKYIKSHRLPEMPLFRRSFLTSKASSSHQHQPLRREKTYDTAINTIAEAPECPEPPARNQGSTINDTSRRSRRQHRDKPTDRPSRRLLEWRSPSRQRRGHSQNHTSRRGSPSPRRSRYDESPADRPLPSSRAGSRYTTPLSYISAALGNDVPRGRQDDVETVMPDDSISCVDLKPRSWRSSAYSRQSRRSDKDRDRDGDRDRNRDGAHGGDRIVRAAQRSVVGSSYENRYDDRNDGRTNGRTGDRNNDRNKDRHSDIYDKYIDGDRTGRRSSTTSLPNRPRETTRQYRYEIRARSRSRVLSCPRWQEKRWNEEFGLICCAV